MGISLLYSRTRVLSFAQFGLGAFAATLFYAWVLYNQWPVLGNGLCHCLGPHGASMSQLQHNPDLFRAYLLHHHPWALALNIVISGALALVLARGAGRLAFVQIAARFARAPRIVPTVATLALAVWLGGAPGLLTTRPTKFFGHHIWSWLPYGPRPGTGINGKPPVPEASRFLAPGHTLLGFTLSGGARFHLYEILAVVVAVGAFGALTLRFRVGRRGLVSRATAANAERAATLGVDIVRETASPWVVAALLSGAAGVLGVVLASSAPVVGLDMGSLTLVLAAVVLARLTSIGLSLVATVLLCVLDQAMFWNFHSHVQFAGSLVVIIGVALFIQRGRASRAERDAESVFTSAPEPAPVPDDVRITPGVHGLLRGSSFVVGMAFLSYPLVATPRQLSLGIVVVAEIVIGLSLLVLSGWGGQVSLGQLGFAAVGGYVATLAGASWHVPMPIALVLGALAAAAIAPLVGLPALRLPGPFVAIMTLAFALAVPAVLLSDGQLLGRALPTDLPRPVMLGLDFGSDRYFYWFAVAVLLGALAIVLGLRRSRLRRALIASRDNARTAASFGVDVTRLRLEGFAVAGLLAGLGGGLLAYSLGGAQPNAFSAVGSAGLFLVVVIGGLSAVSGPVLGATVNGVLAMVSAGLVGFLNGPGALIVLSVRPGGLAGMVAGLRDAAVRVVMHLQGNDQLRLRGVDGRERIPVADRGAQAPVVPVRYRIVGDGYGPVEGTRLRPVDGVTAAAARTGPVGDRDPVAHRTSSEDGAVIACHRLDVAYGGAVALAGVSVAVAAGEVLAVVGLNGAGKTSLLRALAGLEPAAHGTVEVGGVDVTTWFPQARAAAGVAYVPGDDAVLPTLSVRDNLSVAAGDASIDDVLTRFPVLAARLDTAAGNLSGGEQHVLALAQALLCPQLRVLLIDELSLGLSAEVLDTVLATLAELRAAGVAIVVVEQSISTAMDLADNALFLESGRVRYSGPAAALREHPELFASVAFGAGGAATGGGSEIARAQRLLHGERDAVLEVDHVSAAYGDVRVVDDVAFDVTAGEVVGILGPNGAGKTSLFDCLTGELPLAGGAVRLLGTDITTLAPHRRAALGLMRSYQNVRLFPSLTVRDCIAVALETRLTTKSSVFAGLWLPPARAEERRVDERVDGLLELLGLESSADTPVGALSLGARRMVDLACQLAARPKVLLLDEPASGLAHGEIDVLGPLVTRISSDLDCAVLIIEHNVNVLASVAHRLVAMRAGAVIAQGPPADVLADPDVRGAYFGKELQSA